MDDLVARVTAARRTQSQAAVELWNTRLAVMRAAGSVHDVLGHLMTPAEAAGDNCTCNNACNVGCATPGFDAGLAQLPGLASLGDI